jgi:pyruvyltransferase
MPLHSPLTSILHGARTAASARGDRSTGATAAADGPVALYYFESRRHPNVGDRLNVDLLRTLTGRTARAATADDATHVCIGSLLEAFLCRASEPPRGGLPLAVWGAGFIGPPGLRDGRVERPTRPLDVHAVRGRLTLERLRAMGVDVSLTALGDPGLLARMLVPTAPARPRYRLGLVAHYVDERDPAFARVRARVPSTRLIRVGADPSQFLAELRECEMVLSSAMHGLIAADSLGIPNARIRVADRITGGDYKFHDYYSVFGVDPQPLSRDDLWNLTTPDLERIEGAYAITPAAVNRVIDSLLSSCPFTVRAEAAASRVA